MIQDIYPLQMDNQYDPDRLPEPDDLVMSFQGEKVFCSTADGKLRLPCVRDFAKKASVYFFLPLICVTFATHLVLQPCDGDKRWCGAELRWERGENPRQSRCGES